MSLFRNVVVLYLCIGLALSFGGFDTPMGSFINSGGDFNRLVTGLIDSFGFTSDPGTGALTISLIALPAIIAALVAGGGFAFPILIAIIVASMLLPIFTLPVAIGNAGFPPEFQAIYAIFVVLMQFLFTLGLVDWIRGEMN